jgi:hypothetical protein
MASPSNGIQLVVMMATMMVVHDYRTTPRALPLFFGAPAEVILVVCINSPM